VEIVKFGSCEGLLFDGQGHFLLSGYTNVGDALFYCDECRHACSL
jgi:hypothetical protein